VGASLALAGAIAEQAVEIGSKRGGWTYAYVAVPDARLAGLALGGAVAAVLLHDLARRHVGARPALVVTTVLLVGIATQLGLHALYPYALGDLVLSDVVTGFHSAAMRVRPLELLGSFDRVAGGLPVHVQNNMPGKVLLFDLLHLVTTDPEIEGGSIVALSSLAGVVLYAVVARTSGERALGLDALVLWMLVPAKIGLYPLLNVVSPLVAAGALWCALHYVGDGSPAWALATGVLTYVTMLFDPLALWLGVAFVPLFLGVVAARRTPGRDVGGLAVLAAAALAASHVAMRVGTGFDVVARLGRMADAVRAFNLQSGRPRDPWVTGNLREIAIAVGPPVGLTVVVAAAAALVRGAVAARDGVPAAVRRVLEPGPALALGTLAVLAVLDAVCLTRGEVSRLWLFLFLPAQAVAAWWTAGHPWSRRLLVGATFAYATLVAATVGYCVP
jgi:hypothetical protein